MEPLPSAAGTPTPSPAWNDLSELRVDFEINQPQGGRYSRPYELTVVREGALSVLNDLHKGRHTGPAWSIVIDLSAALMAVISVTGLLLLLYLKRRRLAGLITSVTGAVALVVVIWLWIQ